MESKKYLKYPMDQNLIKYKLYINIIIIFGCQHVWDLL